jgi:hypothetical protein
MMMMMIMMMMQFVLVFKGLMLYLLDIKKPSNLRRTPLLKGDSEETLPLP